MDGAVVSVHATANPATAAAVGMGICRRSESRMMDSAFSTGARAPPPNVNEIERVMDAFVATISRSDHSA